MSKKNKSKNSPMPSAEEREIIAAQNRGNKVEVAPDVAPVAENIPVNVLPVVENKPVEAPPVENVPVIKGAAVKGIRGRKLNFGLYITRYINKNQARLTPEMFNTAKEVLAKY